MRKIETCRMVAKQVTETKPFRTFWGDTHATFAAVCQPVSQQRSQSHAKYAERTPVERSCLLLTLVCGTCGTTLFWDSVISAGERQPGIRSFDNSTCQIWLAGSVAAAKSKQGTRTWLHTSSHIHCLLGITECCEFWPDVVACIKRKGKRRVW
jgi:hypothetical protein